MIPCGRVISGKRDLKKTINTGVSHATAPPPPRPPLPLSSPMSSPRTAPGPGCLGHLLPAQQHPKHPQGEEEKEARVSAVPAPSAALCNDAVTRCPREPGFALNTTFGEPRRRATRGTPALGGRVGSSSSLQSPQHGSLSPQPRQQQHLGLIRGKLCSGREWKGPKSFALKGDVTAFPSSKIQDELFRPIVQQLC